MKKAIIFCSLLLVMVAGCGKDSSDNYAAEQAVYDEQLIQSYIKEKSIVGAVKDPSGLYYAVVTPGTGAYPTATSTVNVNYSGTFTDGTPFDSGNYTTVVNGNIIEGWKIGLTKINTGGRILLMVPSALGYGPQGSGRVAANKVLIFQIDMLSIR